MNLTLGRALLSSALLLPLAGCDIPPIDVPFEGSVDIPGCDLPAGCELLAELPEIPGVSDFDIEAAEAFKSAGSALEHVEKVEVSKLELSLSGGDPSFDWLDSVSFYASRLDGSDEVVLGELTLGATEKGGSSIELELSGEDISTLMKEKSLLIRAKANGRPPREETTLKVSGQFSVTVGFSLF